MYSPEFSSGSIDAEITLQQSLIYHLLGRAANLFEAQSDEFNYVTGIIGETQDKIARLEARDVIDLPPRAGPIRGRFDEEAYPELKGLNQKLDELSRNQQGEFDQDSGNRFWNPKINGDPLYLSEELVRTASMLAERGEEELALLVLDEGSRWPETQVTAEHYKRLALMATKHGKLNFMIAIALDNDRLLYKLWPKHLDEIIGYDDNNQRIAEFAVRWIQRVTPFMTAIIMVRGEDNLQPNGRLYNRLHERVDFYTDIVNKYGSLGDISIPIDPYTDQK